jgi:hypothetical protein
MTIKIDFAAIAKEAHETAKASGFWDEDRTPAYMACLIHSQIADAFREWRKWGTGNCMYYEVQSPQGKTTLPIANVDGWKANDPEWKPHGLAVELADVVILLADWTEEENWSIGYEMPFMTDDGTIEDYVAYAHEQASVMGYYQYTGQATEMLLGCVMECSELFNIPLAEAIRVKMAYNKTRVR